MLHPDIWRAAEDDEIWDWGGGGTSDQRSRRPRRMIEDIVDAYSRVFTAGSDNG